MIYAIGDVHGEAGALSDMLTVLPVLPTDLVIFLGDAINRGRNGFDCVEQIIAFDRCRKIFIQGNHEEAMLMFMEEGAVTALTGMDAQGTLDSYTAAGCPLTPGGIGNLPEPHQRFYAMAYPWTLPFYITDQYIFTHAGWDLALPLERQSSGALRWGKVKGYETPAWTQTVVRGHTPFPQVMFARTRRYIGVDTGCGLGGFLSCLCLPTGETWDSRPASYSPLWFERLRGPAPRSV